MGKYEERQVFLEEIAEEASRKRNESLKQKREERRAQFAAMAMQGLLAGRNTSIEHTSIDWIARTSVECAQALIKALEERGES